MVEKVRLAVNELLFRHFGLVTSRANDFPDKLGNLSSWIRPFSINGNQIIRVVDKVFFGKNSVMIRVSVVKTFAP